MKSYKQYISETSVDEGFRDFFKKKPKIDIKGWKAKIHQGKHPDVPDISSKGNILFAINPKTGEEEHIASGNLSDKDIKKLVKMYGLEEGVILEGRRDLTLKFPSINQAIGFISKVKHPVIHTSYPVKKDKSVVKVKWSGTHERTVRDAAGKFNGSPWYVKESSILEGRRDLEKGWTLKNKIVISTNDYDYYHIMQIVKEPRKFGLDKKKILKIIRDSYPDAPDAWIEDHYWGLGDGIVDNDKYIEDYLMKKGYCRFVIDKTHGCLLYTSPSPRD